VGRFEGPPEAARIRYELRRVVHDVGNAIDLEITDALRRMPEDNDDY
jgi:hypothetical protein